MVIVSQSERDKLIAQVDHFRMQYRIALCGLVIQTILLILV